MNLEEAKLFDALKEQKEAMDGLVNEIITLADDVWPIAHIMKHFKMTFVHPDLPDAKTKRGPIIGVNQDDMSELFVYDNGCVYSCSNEFCIIIKPFKEFVRYCDHEFAIKGFKTLYSNASKMITLLGESKNEIATLAERLSKERIEREK